jgi:uncharacterized protein YdiU (UPF0061 family)
MTIFFRKLADIEEAKIESIADSFYDISRVSTSEWEEWLGNYLSLVKSNRTSSMHKHNPKYVLRNWMAQLAIDKAEQGDFSIVDELYELLKNPYDEQPEMEEDWYQKRPEWAKNRVGCSMLSCSS